MNSFQLRKFQLMGVCIQRLNIIVSLIIQKTMYRKEFIMTLIRIEGEHLDAREVFFEMIMTFLFFYKNKYINKTQIVKDTVSDEVGWNSLMKCFYPFIRYLHDNLHISFNMSCIFVKISFRNKERPSNDHFESRLRYWL